MNSAGQSHLGGQPLALRAEHAQGMGFVHNHYAAMAGSGIGQAPFTARATPVT